MLVAERDGARIEAQDAERGPLYVCPYCRSEVILKKPRMNIDDHFAHKPPTDCAYALNETQAHLRAKRWMADQLRALGAYIVELEIVIADRRADILVTNDMGQQLAVELQHTNIQLDEIEARANDYARHRIAQLWVPFLHGQFAMSEIAGGWLIRRYQARPFEKWVHGFGKGTMWLYDPRTPSLYCGHMEGHRLYKEGADWYTEDGEPTGVNGYSYWSKRWREVTLKGPYHQIKGIAINRRSAWSRSPYSWPAGEIANFLV